MTRFLFLLAFLLPLSGFAQTTVTTSYSSGTPVIYDAAGVSTSGTVVMSGTANVSFVADNHVTLNAGFKVSVGALFRAKAGTDADNDGMPNAWENTSGLNTALNDAQSDKDADGLANIVEYQMGTNANGSSSYTTDSGNTTDLRVHKPN